MKRDQYIKAMTERAQVAAVRSACRPGTAEEAMRQLELDRVDERLRGELGPWADLNLRSLFFAPEGRRRSEFRAIGATARTAVADRGDFGEVFLSALAGKVPLLKVARLVETPTGADYNYAYVASLASADGVVADGGALTSGDWTFGGGTSKSWKYSRLVKVSAETMTDTFGDIEGAMARDLADMGMQRESDEVAGLMLADLNDDLWGGDGTSAPQGLLAGPSTTTAASASTVVVDDVFNAMGNVAAQYWDTASVLSSAGALIQLRRQTLGTSAAGGQAVPVTAPIVNTLPWPTYADAGLATPATTVKTLVCGSFEHAYLVRMTPVSVAVDQAANYDTDLVSVRVSFRADGRRLNTAALRVLVMA